VIRPTRHARGLAIAIVTLVLTAGVAIAARPSSAPPPAASTGLDRATDASGMTVPVVPAALPDLDDQSEGDVDEPDNEPAEEPADAPTGEHPDNHGAAVSEAATSDTPDGFDNHGQYVRSVATDNHGQETAADARVNAEAKGNKPNR
jgi:hypothetical protein